ncbi:cation efflux protein [Lipomyces arxii]|uniref:cation efflux protein n=1 Tax=Lipomyces arxii TaxID=56418 RepID=UPI0034CEBB7C
MPSPLIRSTSSFAAVTMSVNAPTSESKGKDSQTSGFMDMMRHPWQMVQSMLLHKDTRSIFLFLLLNFTFMFVQFVYSLLSHSLGLLSDSIHMLLDCVALLVGLLASVMAKWPPSASFPYGLGKVESLSGFINGVLLIGISGGIVVEAIERIWRPVEIERVPELLVVSFLGLIVNLIGIVAFNHGHAHGSSHSHSHSHSDSHSHSHSHHDHHDHDQDESSDDVFSTPSSIREVTSSSSPFACGDGHDVHKEDKGGLKHNENMHGLFLHILADTLGSVGVIVSTGLTSVFGWSGFDPLASLFIAVLIFISAVPLVTSSASSLLLSLTSEQEYVLRDALNEVVTVPGVIGYSFPRFWPVECDGTLSVRGTIHVQISHEADAAVVREKVDARLCSALKGASDLFIQIERK